MMLPPDPPPPDLPTSVNGHAHDPRRPAEGRAGEGDGRRNGVRRPPAGGGRPRLAFVRLLLLALSTIGVGAAFVLLVGGHPTLAGRVLAGDVLLILGILIIA